MRYALLVLIGVLAVGCGGSGDKTGATDQSTDCPAASNGPSVRADLDGDGAPETVTFATRAGATQDCPAAFLNSKVAGRSVGVGISDDLKPAQDGLQAVAIPDREGDLVLLKLDHPRGGFQVRLYGYADGKLDELRSGGKPVFEFLATDAPTEHVSAACTKGGFTVTEAVAHQPIGVIPAWDIYRTPYTIDGNTLTAGDRAEVADNVLDKDLASKYPDLVANRLFANC